MADDAVRAGTSLPETASAAEAVSGHRGAMWLLLLIYTFNFLDRQVINILAEPIKLELGLADWQLGVMTGLAFALLYSVLGIPIARLAEHGDRPRIIAASVFVWSSFTVACSFVTSFPQMILARFGVGIGEAGCSPPAHSLISDYMPREKRASGLAFYAMGTPLGTLLGMALGGVIADAYGWRAAFLVAGAPGLLLALLAATTLHEPRRKLRAAIAQKAAQRPKFADACRELATKRTFWLIAFAAAFQAFVTYGQTAFTASFFLRNHTAELASLGGMFGLKSAGFLGIAIGLTSGVAGILGAVLGGRLSDRLIAKDLRAHVYLPAAFAALALPFVVGAMLAPSAAVGILLLAGAAFLNTAWFGPVYASIQGLVRPETRATAAAVLLFTLNLIGLGFGPLAVGAISDLLATTGGLGAAEGLRWAKIIGEGVIVVSIVLFLLAAKTIDEETVS
ncbi:spinster family MFS transporter [Phenylobacterium aquaticum]|uniref:spinster family MFS transporter n=1 Tax=Phenylobacterium aquaticum TaxID=1763816 RepID=UPI001F5C2D64|nr:MFS transporter [Phenylobacterium aquaticum]MCI3132225.1 MFS transporter [Phenylobacterium aquaticum]